MHPACLRLQLQRLGAQLSLGGLPQALLARLAGGHGAADDLQGARLRLGGLALQGLDLLFGLGDGGGSGGSGPQFLELPALAPINELPKMPTHLRQALRFLILALGQRRRLLALHGHLVEERAAEGRGAVSTALPATRALQLPCHTCRAVPRTASQPRLGGAGARGVRLLASLVHAQAQQRCNGWAGAAA